MYRIEQTYDYAGNDLWNWSVRIGGDKQELDRLVKVIWYLHHTFSNPVVTVTKRETQFELNRKGWGVFQLRAELFLDDGSKQMLTHWLELAYPEEEHVAPTRGAPARKGSTKYKVFLSYGAEDRKLVAQVRGKLEERGYQVLDPSNIEAGMPVEAAVSKMVRDSDLVMGFVTSDFVSPFVVSELNKAKSSQKPVLAVIKPGIEQPYGLDEELNRVEIDLDAEYASDELADVVAKLEP
ncbi:MAG: TIR domain-containing protein [Gammaproteobacteria bacterium]|jgi:hypothetical protein